MTPRWTSEQKNAILNLNDDLFVSASAGTGKTEVLVQRYLQILDQKRAKVTSILSITFTEKAAHEMKQRIFKQIHSKVKNASDLVDRNYWRQVKRDFRYNSIGTIHSICFQWIRRSARVLGIPNAVEVVDEARLMNDLNWHIQNMVSKWLKEDDETEQKIDLLLFEHFCIDSDSISENNSLISRLSQCFMQFYQDIDTSDSWTDISLEAWTSRCQDWIELQCITAWNEFFSQQQELKQHLDSFNLREKIKVSNRSPLKSAFLLLYEFIDNMHDYQWSSNSLLISEQMLNLYAHHEKRLKSGLTITDLKYDWDEHTLDCFKTFVQMMIDVFPKWLLELFNMIQKCSKLLQYQYQVRQSLIKLCCALKQSMRDLPETHLLSKWQRKYVLRYDDLQSLALKLLKQSDDASIHDLNLCFDYIMIDECQDLDAIQAELIQILKQKNPRMNLFLVGDEKQSIYGFRGSDLDILKRFKDSQLKMCRIDLTTNFRSDKELVHFFDQFIVHHSTRLSKGYPKVAHQYAHEPRIELAICDALPEWNDANFEIQFSSKSKKEQQIYIEAYYLAQRIIQLTSNPHDQQQELFEFGDIAILFQTLTHIAIYEEILTQWNIPLQRLSSQIETSREWLDALNLLRWINHPNDAVYLCGVLRSPWCGVSDTTLYYLVYSASLHKNDASYVRESLPLLVRGFLQFEKNQWISKSEKDKLRHFQEQYRWLNLNYSQKSLSYCLRQMLKRTGCLNVGSDSAHQLQINWTALLNWIYSNEKQHPAWSLADVIKELELYIKMAKKQKLNLDESVLNKSVENKVQLMTVHKSKGKEFPVVVLTDLTRDLKKDIVKMANINTQIGLVVKTDLNQQQKQFDALLLKKHQTQQQYKNMDEHHRLFYVGCTRAEKRLILSGFSSKINKNKRYNWNYYILNAFQNEFDLFLEQCVQSLSQLDDNNSTVHFEYHGVRFCLYRNFKTIFLLKQTHYQKQQQSNRLEKQYCDKRISPIQTAPLDTTSTTALLDYEKCPRKFFYKFIQQIKESQEGLISQYRQGIKEEIKNIASGKSADLSWLPLNLFGNLMHTILDNPIWYHSTEYIRSHLDGLIENTVHCERSTLLSQYKKNELISELKAILTDFLSSDLYFSLQQMRQKNPNKTWQELSFNVKVGGMSIEGRMDQVFFNERQELSVIDYKTTKLKKDKSEYYGIQMLIYQLAIATMFNKPSDHNLFYFLLHQTKMSYNPDEEKKLKLKDDINYILDKTKKQHSLLQYFSPKPSHHCQFCGYWMCEGRQKKQSK